MGRGRDIAGFILTVFRGFIADSNSSGAKNVFAFGGKRDCCVRDGANQLSHSGFLFVAC